MSVQVASNRFIVSSLVKHAGFYQQLFDGISSIQELGNRLIREAETSYAFRQTDRVEELGLILSNISIKEYSLIGQYYLGWCAYRKGENARPIFEQVITESKTYKVKGLISLAAVEASKGDYASELRYYTEAAKHADTHTNLLASLKAIAVVKAKEGFRPQALKDLESIAPLIHHASPKTYFDYLNSLAVELGEAGRKEEARRIINHVIASPFAPAYPEWQETARELKPANRSCIRVPEIKPQQAEIEPTEDEEQASEPDQPAAIVSFPKLKEADPPKKPERITPQELSEMTRSEKRELILAAVRSDAIRESEYNKLIFMFGLLDRGPGVNILDLEDETVLDDVMVDWANLVPPEELASVLSALRDCEDDRRRNDLIDRMIRKAFEQSRICGLTESEWRHKVESKLP